MISHLKVVIVMQATLQPVKTDGDSEFYSDENMDKNHNERVAD